MTSPAYRRLWLALAGALLLHGAVALLLLRLAPPPRPARRPVTVAIELRTVPGPAAPGRAGSAPAPAGPQAPGDRAAARQAAQRGAKRKDAAAAASRPPAGAAAPAAIADELTKPSSPAAPPPEAGSLAWKRAEGIEPSPAPVWGKGFGLSQTLRDPGASLGPGARAGASARGGAGGQGDEGGLPVRVPTREEALAEEKARVGNLLDAWVGDAQARARADGPRDAYWQTVQDQLEHGFAPTWELRDAGKSASAVRSAVGAAVDEYRRELQAYGATGSPLAPAARGPGAHGPGTKAPLADEFLGLAAEERGLRGTVLEHPPAAMTLEALGQALSGEGSQWHTKLVVRILLTQRPDGAIEAAEVAASSGNPLYDRLALDQARGLGRAGLLGAPPQRHLRSLWAFETDFLQQPPLPMAGCALDDFVPVLKECFYPFKKKVHAGVHLEAVY